MSHQIHIELYNFSLKRGEMLTIGLLQKVKFTSGSTKGKEKGRNGGSKSYRVHRIFNP